MKTIFTDIEDDLIRHQIINIAESCTIISDIIAPNEDLAKNLIGIMNELKEFGKKMRDKYCEEEEPKWKKFRPYLKV